MLERPEDYVEDEIPGGKNVAYITEKDIRDKLAGFDLSPGLTPFEEDTQRQIIETLLRYFPLLGISGLMLGFETAFVLMNVFAIESALQMPAFFKFLAELPAHPGVVLAFVVPLITGLYSRHQLKTAASQRVYTQAPEQLDKKSDE